MPQKISSLLALFVIFSFCLSNFAVVGSAIAESTDISRPAGTGFIPIAATMTKRPSGSYRWSTNRISVTPGTAYTYSDNFWSKQKSYLLARFELTTGKTVYRSFKALSPSNGWATSTLYIIAPANAESMTVWHMNYKKGILQAKNFILQDPAAVETRLDESEHLVISGVSHGGGGGAIIGGGGVSVNPSVTPKNPATTTPPAATTTPTTTPPTATTTPTSTPPTGTSTPTTTIPVDPTVIAKGGFVTFDFDDNNLSAYQKAVPILNNAGIRGTFFIVTGPIQQDAKHMTYNQILDVYHQGYEIGSHTRTHPDLTTLSTSSATAEITGSKQDLQNLGISNVETFAYPFTALDDGVVQLVKNAGYTGARTVWSIAQNSTATNPYYLRSEDMVSGSTTLSYLEQEINQAVKNKTWYIMNIHNVDENVQYNTSSQLLQQVVDYVRQNNIPAVTINQGLHYFMGR